MVYKMKEARKKLKNEVQTDCCLGYVMDQIEQMLGVNGVNGVV